MSNGREHETRARSAKSRPQLPNEDRIAILHDVFPEVFRDGVFDGNAMSTALAGIDDPRKERYSLGWSGKSEAIRRPAVPSTRALAPVTKRSREFDITQNVIIAGENLEALKLLYKAYFGRVNVIYIDPPYNTGNDRVYADDYTESSEGYLRRTGQTNASELMTSNPETGGRFHSNWLSLMYPRLWIARQLLREDGIMCLSIDDHEVHNLRLIMNEIFGEENFIAQIAIETNPKGRVLREHFARNHDYLLVYARAELTADLAIELTEDEVRERYDQTDEKGFRFRYLELRNTHRQFGQFNRRNLYYPLFVSSTGEVSLTRAGRSSVEVLPDWDDGFKGCWTWDRDNVTRNRHLLLGREVKGRWKVFRRAYYDSPSGEQVRKKLKTIWAERQYHTEVGQQVLDQLIPGRVFDSPKPPALIRTILQLANDPDALVLDFFAGSGSTAQAVIEENRTDGGNRRFVLIQVPELTAEDSNARKAGFKTVSDICVERVSRFLQAAKNEGTQLALTPRNLPEDLGFRLFEARSSNLRRWADVAGSDEGALLQQLELMADGLATDANEEDVLWEVLLQEGYSLSSSVTKVPNGSRISALQIVDMAQDQRMFASLADVVTIPDVQALGLAKTDLFLCRDSALDDTAVANLQLQVRLRTI